MGKREHSLVVFVSFVRYSLCVGLIIFIFVCTFLYLPYNNSRTMQIECYALKWMKIRNEKRRSKMRDALTFKRKWVKKREINAWGSNILHEWISVIMTVFRLLLLVVAIVENDDDVSSSKLIDWEAAEKIDCVWDGLSIWNAPNWNEISNLATHTLPITYTADIQNVSQKGNTYFHRFLIFFGTIQFSKQK